MGQDYVSFCFCGTKIVRHRRLKKAYKLPTADLYFFKEKPFKLQKGDYNMEKIKNSWESKRRSSDRAALITALAVTLGCFVLLVIGFVVTGSLIGLF